MIGHQAVIAMRLQGKVPRLVVLDDVRILRQWGEDERGNRWVHIERHENPDRLDLRFLKGVKFMVFCDDAQRQELIEQAAVKAGAEVADGAVA